MDIKRFFWVRFLSFYLLTTSFFFSLVSNQCNKTISNIYFTRIKGNDGFMERMIANAANDGTNE
jgi:sensor histidine kinase YesM